MMRVLLIEDDAETATLLAAALAGAGYGVDCAADGPTGLAQALSSSYDVLIVDRMLPQMDGLSLVRQARDGGVGAHVIFLTGLGAVADRVAGLDGGGDDYLVKPVSPEEIAARLNAIARRAAPREEPSSLAVADLVMNRIKRTVLRGGVLIELQLREYEILELLMLNAGRTITRKTLLEEIWRFTFDPGTNIVESHMSRIRSKIDRVGDPPLIHTVRGAGYVLRQP